MLLGTALLAAAATLGNAAQVYWHTECGCTGLEVEAVSWICPFVPRDGLATLAVNRCSAGNGRCAYAEDLVRCMDAAEDVGDAALGPDALAVVHIGYRGVCGSETGRVHERVAAAKHRVLRSMYEVDRIPADAVERCNDAFYDAVWVPSTFVRDAFVASGVHADRLVVVPAGIDTTVYRAQASEDDVALFTFAGSAHAVKLLSAFKFEERKNWQALIRAFADEFGKDGGVELHIKTAVTFGRDPRREMPRYLGQPLEAVGIHLVMDRLDAKAMAAMYRQADAFILPSHAEGFGLTFLEAMACGLPTAGLDFGGSLDFMADGENALLMPVERLSPGFSGFRWADVALADVRRTMRRLVDERATLRATIGAAAAASVAADFSADVVFARHVRPAMAAFVGEHDEL